MNTNIPNPSRTVFTGDRPTGSLHLGHFVGSLQNRLKLQEDGYQLTILIADTQVLNNDVSKAQNVKENILEVMKDYLSIGLNPEKVRFVLQSQILELFELTNYLSNIVPINHLMRVPTLKKEAQMYQGGKGLSLGFINYPIAQTADIILFEPDLVPVGEDQVPVLEFGNDIIRMFHNSFQCEIFKKIVPMISEIPRLVGTDGYQKMSKSLGNVIGLNYSKKEIEDSVRKMYTDPGHIKVSDPGKIEGHVVFKFLELFHSNKIEVEALKAHYQKGGLGDMVLKKMLMQDLDNLIAPMREKRLLLKDDDLLDILKSGTKSARQQAQVQMEKVREIVFR